MINDTKVVEIKILEESLFNKEILCNFLTQINNGYLLPVSEKVDLFLQQV